MNPDEYRTGVGHAILSFINCHYFSRVRLDVTVRHSIPAMHQCLCVSFVTSQALPAMHLCLCVSFVTSQALPAMHLCLCGSFVARYGSQAGGVAV